MASMADYFEKQAYQHIYEMGDRITGKYQGIPFIGTVGNDRLLSHEAGPEITVHLDLPMQTDTGVRYVIVVKHDDVERLK